MKDLEGITKGPNEFLYNSQGVIYKNKDGGVTSTLITLKIPDIQIFKKEEFPYFTDILHPSELIELTTPSELEKELSHFSNAILNILIPYLKINEKFEMICKVKEGILMSLLYQPKFSGLTLSNPISLISSIENPKKGIYNNEFVIRELKKLSN